MKDEEEAMCLLFQKIEWSEAMRPANGVNRYQNVKVEEAFRRYNASVNMPRRVIERTRNSQFHIGCYEELCNGEVLEVEKFRSYDEE